MQVLTPSGYKDSGDIAVGDEVRYFDLVTGEPLANTVLKLEWIDKDDFRLRCAPQTYNDGEEPPTLKPEDIPFDFYKINDTWTLYQDQSIWYSRGGTINVCHIKDLEVGDVIFSDTDTDITITSIENIGELDGWLRFAISGDCSYIVDGLTLHNASRFWVGGGSANTWAAITNTNWSATSGGANNASVPTTTDQVFFDAASGTRTTISNLSTAFTIQGINCTGYVGQLFHTNNITLTINTGSTDSLIIPTSVNYNLGGGNCHFTFTHTSGTATITLTGGTVSGTLTINAPGGTVQLGADYYQDMFLNVGGGITLTAGTFNANGYKVIIGNFSSNNANTRTVTMGTGDWYLARSNGNATVFDINNSTGLTFNKHTGGAKTYISGGVQYGKVLNGNLGTTFNVPSGVTFGDIEAPSNTLNGYFHTILLNGSGAVYGNITVGAGIALSFTPNSTVTVANLTVNGTRDKPSLVTANFTGTQISTVSCSGTVSLNWCALSAITFTGGGTFTTSNCYNFGDMSGITVNGPTVPFGTQFENPGYTFNAGATSQSINVFIPKDSTAVGGAIGLLYNTSGLSCYARAGIAASAAVTLTTQTVAGAYSSGGFVEIDSTNMPGVYRFDIPNSLLSSAGQVTLYFKGAAGMLPVIVSLNVLDRYDVDVKYVNNTAVTGTGSSPTWGP